MINLPLTNSNTLSNHRVCTTTLPPFKTKTHDNDSVRVTKCTAYIFKARVKCAEPFHAKFSTFFFRRLKKKKTFIDGVMQRLILAHSFTSTERRPI